MTYQPLNRPFFVQAVLAFLFSAGIAPLTNLCVAQDAAKEKEAQFFTDVQQLTFEGARSGEGYYSADGNLMIFQSERGEDNPFYQIYLMDFQTGDVERISPGHGKTTCAWVHPSMPKALFASTQDDPDAFDKQKQEIEDRQTGNQRRYSWDYDEFYEIYAYDLNEKSYTKLTDAKGYDAEGSYSPDGNLVAFASNRRAYSGDLSEEEQKAFEFHQAAVMDIYIMNSDGTNVKRLTEALGYDGGPFFSPDGKRICWRRFKPDASSAEIWTMNIDGSDKRQLTQLHATSFAPFYHPSNKYLLFMSNIEGYGNFEIYMVPTGMRADPVRVTFTEGFDGFPVFSPDGKTLSWTTNRSDKKSQIHRAKWNHEAAMTALGLTERAVSAAELQEATDRALESAEQTAVEFRPEDVLRHVDYLCRQDLGGRMTGSLGERKATAYVAAYLDSLGFVPAGDVDPETGEATWYQEFDFPAGAEFGAENSLAVGDMNVKMHDEWRPLSYSGTGKFEGDVVFAGYGIKAPATDDLEEYNSFADLDVKDKWVVVFRFLPEDVTPEWRQQRQLFSSLRFKAMTARDLGALGLIVVSGPNSKVRNQVIPLSGDASLEKTNLAVISVSDSVGESILKSTGKSLSELQTELDSGKLIKGTDAKGTRVAASIDVVQKRGTGRNVIGRLQAGDAPADQSVMVGAHIDHLGRGGPGSLAKEDEKTQIHYGADDNASGVAASLEVAQFLANLKKEGKLDARRDILIAAWSGEELGLHGSRHYVQAEIEKNVKAASDPHAPGVDSIYPKYVAYLNMDMVGRFDTKLVLQGIGSSNYWKGEIEKRNIVVGIPLKLNDDTNLPTDATEFYQAGVPILSAFTGSHSDYHTPRDTPEKLDYDRAAQIAKLMGLITRSLAVDSETPDYIKRAKQEQRMRVAARVSLGTSPDYTEEITGVAIKSVRTGSPAEKAGIEGGDIIVELAGIKIENIYDYVNAIGTLKVDVKVKVVVMRGDERIELDIVPEPAQ